MVFMNIRKNYISRATLGPVPTKTVRVDSPLTRRPEHGFGDVLRGVLCEICKGPDCRAV